MNLDRPLDSEEQAAVSLVGELADGFAMLLESQAGIDALAGLDTAEIRELAKGFRTAHEKARSARTLEDALTVSIFYKGVEVAASPSIRRAVRAGAKTRNFQPKEGRA